MEQGHYAPEYTARDRRIENAFDAAYDDFKASCKTFEGAVKFLNGHADAEHVLALLLMRWSNGKHTDADEELNSLICSAATFKSEEDL